MREKKKDEGKLMKSVLMRAKSIRNYQLKKGPPRTATKNSGTKVHTENLTQNEIWVYKLALYIGSFDEEK